MLVLSRKPGETIQIGQDILITVIRTGQSVKIGVTAPKDVTVLRGELYGDPASEILAQITHKAGQT